MRQLIAGNWKMNGLLEASAALAGALRHGGDGLSCDIVVCPPATMVMTIAHVLVGSAVEVGGQDCHARTSGPHTGDVSAAMLRDAGARWVILGHSERRAMCGESDASINKKVLAALDNGIVPIVAVGETAEEHTAGHTHTRVVAQARAAFAGVSAGDVARCVVAYEPIWAIGSGNSDSPEGANEVMGAIRAGVPGLDATRILYGGSVKPENIAALVAQPHIDGALVGGASLDPISFAALVHNARKGVPA